MDGSEATVFLAGRRSAEQFAAAGCPGWSIDLARRKFAEARHLTRYHRQNFGFRVLTGVLFAAACGGGGESTDGTGSRAPELHGTELVVGSTLDEWGVLVLDPSGGTATLRPMRSPRETAWESETELPAFDEVRSIGGSSVVLRSGDGSVSRFDPAADAVETLDRLQGEAVRWVGSDQGGVFVNGASGEILAVLPDRAWRYDVGGAVDWAAAVHDGIVVLRPGPELWLVPHGAEEPSGEASVAVRGPGLVTAWGRRLVFVDSEDGRSVQVLTVEPMETAGRVELDGPVTALAASPSSHELYAGVSDPPGVVVINRFSFTTRSLARLDRPPVEIRPSLFGEYLLVFDGERTWRIEADDGHMVLIPGDWGADLPLGLPDGFVVSRTGGGVSLVGPDGRIEGDPLEVTASAAWLPVRWTPIPRGFVDELEGRPLAVSPGRPAPDVTGPEAEGDQPVTERATPPDVPVGYYAIVGSARQRDGIDALVSDLGAAGFPVQVQSIADRAGEDWYRGLVGPYATRAEADAAARQLQRERQLQSWVTGINADS